MPTGFCAGIAIYQQRFVVLRAGYGSSSILSNTGESLTWVRLISASTSSSILHFFQEFQKSSILMKLTFLRILMALIQDYILIKCPNRNYLGGTIAHHQGSPRYSTQCPTLLAVVKAFLILADIVPNILKTLDYSLVRF